MLCEKNGVEFIKKEQWLCIKDILVFFCFLFFSERFRKLNFVLVSSTLTNMLANFSICLYLGKSSFGSRSTIFSRHGVLIDKTIKFQCMDDSKFFPSNLLCLRFSDTKVKDYYTYNYDKFSFGVYESVNSSLQLNFMYTAWHFALRCICRYDLLEIILTPFDWSFIVGVFLGGREQRLGYLQALFFFIMQTGVFYRDSTIEKKIPVTWHMFEIAN